MTISEHSLPKDSADLLWRNETLSYLPSHLHLSSVQDTEDTLVSYEARRLFLWIGIAVVCQVIDIFGTVTNIINIICFVQQGFKDPVNVSLL
ncbi:unnamed protein product, partial [Candidula unifasciata]